ncbi:RNA polymerase sigma factor [Ornithinibacillus halophilus]|uniref:RNA polymerase sigma-70 factor, ECF subfamily n=1 Tax=Ornithinibacillus halophilus TaxID=930117 RepID=A0A1M5NM23_9BACI|nr:sigma-70 family RNA polymerase sigma factor [Ornithinibacillus halophilus]SHG90562.1 RNA polymerase sigma-70 factor, ECF subfamily [Ornithinibacillus halophilus]
MAALHNKILVKKIKKKDMHAIIDWFETRQTKFYRIGWAYLHNHHDVEDVFQTTILKIYDKIAQLRNPEYFESWATSIFINECKNLYRKNKRNDVDEREPIDNTHIQDLRMDIVEALDHMEEKYQEIINLRYFSDFSQEKIAEILEVPIGTVKSRIYRGLKLLRTKMERGV